jgi:hypothetical protein
MPDKLDTYTLYVIQLSKSTAVPHEVGFLIAKNLLHQYRRDTIILQRLLGSMDARMLRSPPPPYIRLSMEPVLYLQIADRNMNGKSLT